MSRLFCTLHANGTLHANADVTEAEMGQYVSIAIFHFRMEVCNGNRARMEVRNGRRTRMEACNGIFFAGPSSYSVRKRDRVTREYCAFIISCIMHA